MHLPPFELHRVDTVAEATELLDRFGGDAAIHCGGTELVLAMKLGFAPYGHLVDIKAVDELRGVSAAGDLWIGAATTHQAIVTHSGIRSRWPGLAEMAASVGNARVRNVGTVGGNLCFGEPHSDPATALLAAGATLECRRGDEKRRVVSMTDFATGPFQSALRPGELLLGVRVPPLEAGATLLHRKIRFHERAAAAVTMSVRVVDNRVELARLAVGAVGNVPRLLADADTFLDGAPADALPAAVVDALAGAAARAGQPVTDAYGSADYKAHLVRVLVRRCLAEVVGSERRDP